MTTFVISDRHFFHENILKFCGASRPFSSVEEMNQKLIDDHNSVVGVKDIVYDLGDFAYHGKKHQIQDAFSKLNGIKRLIVGNHDHSVTRKLPWDSIDTYKEINEDGQMYVLMHYPIENWNIQTHGSIHLHGHVHTMPPHPDHRPRLSAIDNRFDVGVDRQWSPGFMGPLPLSFFRSMKVVKK